MSDTVLSGLVINDKYQILKKIGSGSYGMVYLTRHIYSNKLYAIKAILKRQHSSDQEQNKKLLLQLEDDLFQSSKPSTVHDCLMIQNNLLNLDLIEKFGYNCKILKEISLQLKIHTHPNILSIYKVYDNPLCLFVVMDYYEEGDLFQSIVDKKLYKDNPNLIKNVFLQLIDAINYCHSHNVYHCDLKPENILVSNNGTKLVIADFGLSLQEEFISSSISCGSSYYMAPERIDYQAPLERIPTKAGDVWSLAIILINLISIRNPWLKASSKDHTFAAYMKDKSVLAKILPLSDEIFELLTEKYLVLNPFERHSLFEFRYDIINVKKFSSVGPLSVDCQDQFLNNSCLIPFNHVDNSSNSMEDQDPILPSTHPAISTVLHSSHVETTYDHHGCDPDSSASSSCSSCSDVYEEVEDEVLETPPTTYPSSPVLIGGTVENKRVNLSKMLNDINTAITFTNTNIAQI